MFDVFVNIRLGRSPTAQDYHSGGQKPRLPFLGLMGAAQVTEIQGKSQHIQSQLVYGIRNREYPMRAHKAAASLLILE
jgi:hypothetical protein